MLYVFFVWSTVQLEGNSAEKNSKGWNLQTWSYKILMKTCQPEMETVSVIEALQEMVAFQEIVSQELSDSKSDSDWYEDFRFFFSQEARTYSKTRIRKTKTSPEGKGIPHLVSGILHPGWRLQLVNQKQVTCVCTYLVTCFWNYPVTWGQNSNWNEGKSSILTLPGDILSYFLHSRLPV